MSEDAHYRFPPAAAYRLNRCLFALKSDAAFRQSFQQDAARAMTEAGLGDHDQKLMLARDRDALVGPAPIRTSSSWRSCASEWTGARSNISEAGFQGASHADAEHAAGAQTTHVVADRVTGRYQREPSGPPLTFMSLGQSPDPADQIGRASCKERV